MTKIKLCGLTRPVDVEAANSLLPEYVGFVFASKSRRYIKPTEAADLRKQLDFRISAVGVFVDDEPSEIARLLNTGVIDLAQLHGKENENYIRHLRELTDRPLIQALRINNRTDVEAACKSMADYILLDSGSGGTGTSFDWNLIRQIDRPFFLAGGLGVDNVRCAVEMLRPYAVDVSSGIETDGLKDRSKMAEFVRAVRRVKEL